MGLETPSNRWDRVKRLVPSPTTPWGAPISSALRRASAGVSKRSFSAGLGVWQPPGALPARSPEQDGNEDGMGMGMGASIPDKRAGLFGTSIPPADELEKHSSPDNTPSPEKNPNQTQTSTTMG